MFSHAETCSFRLVWACAHRSVFQTGVRTDISLMCVQTKRGLREGRTWFMNWVSTGTDPGITIDRRGREGEVLSFSLNRK